jgi:hypothetical protein
MMRRTVGAFASLVFILAATAVAWLMAAFPPAAALADEIPAFARKYRTSCSTCHTAAPKLNVMGEAFRLNGYRFPVNDQLLRKDDPVELGAEPWKDLWPRSIWPGEITDTPPIALRVQTDLVAARDATANTRVSFHFPHEVYLLAGSTLGETISFFLETEWSRAEGLQVIQAKAAFQDLIPGLPDRSLNLWVGLQNPYLFTFTDRQIDRAARQKFFWQEFRFSDVELTDLLSGATFRSDNAFGLGRTYPTLELNGLIGGRLYYGVGVSQGAGDQNTDNNDDKDFYYKLRYKLGGLRLDGTYPEGGGPILSGHGQLLDRAIILEHFGYFGAEPVADDLQDHHRFFGVNARALVGRLDLGVGYTWGSDDDPWAFGGGGLDVSTIFAKAEYMFYPWLIGSFKFDSLDLSIPEAALMPGFGASGLDRTRLMPGVIFLIRQNVRGVVEAELFTEHQPSAAADLSRPRSLWLRLDVAF